MEQTTETDANSYALLTLKERCHFLKEQLKTVDEENVKLKIQIASGNIKTDGGISSTNMLVEQVESLKKENSQLSNQVNILATENSNLWNRLSKLTVINKTLTRRMQRISETLDKQGISSSFCDSDPEGSVTIDSSISRKDLEELSVRIIKGIKLEKTELDKQYSEMVALNAGKSNVNIAKHDLAFTSMEGDEDNMLGAIRKHSQKMSQMKQTLAYQHGLLLSALEDLKRFRLERATGNRIEKITNDAATETNDDLPVVMTTSSDRPVIEINANAIDVPHENADQMCPMCQNHFPVGQMLVDHVVSHFEDDETERSFVHIP